MIEKLIGIGILLPTTWITVVGFVGNAVEEAGRVDTLTKTGILGLVAIVAVIAAWRMYQDVQHSHAQSFETILQVTEKSMGAIQASTDASRAATQVMVEVKDVIQKCRRRDRD